MSFSVLHSLCHAAFIYFNLGWGAVYLVYRAVETYVSQTYWHMGVALGTSDSVTYFENNLC